MTAEWEADEWLLELARRRWTMIVCGDRQEPEALTALNRGHYWADVIILRDEARAAAYRALLRPHDDPLLADRVVWHYLGSAGWTIRAGLTVPDGVLKLAPYPIPDECRLREAQRRSLTIRLGTSASAAVPLSGELVSSTTTGEERSIPASGCVPQRGPELSSLARPVNVATDPVLLQRLLAGLRQLPTSRPSGRTRPIQIMEGEDR